MSRFKEGDVVVWLGITIRLSGVSYLCRSQPPDDWAGCYLWSAPEGSVLPVWRCERDMRLATPAEAEAYYKEHPDERPVKWPRYVLTEKGRVIRFDSNNEPVWFRVTPMAFYNDYGPFGGSNLEDVVSNPGWREVTLREAVEALWPHRDVWLGILSASDQHLWRLGMDGSMTAIETNGGHENPCSRDLAAMIEYDDISWDYLILLTEAEARARIKKPEPQPEKVPA